MGLNWINSIFMSYDPLIFIQFFHCYFVLCSSRLVKKKRGLLSSLPSATVCKMSIHDMPELWWWFYSVCFLLEILISSAHVRKIKCIAEVFYKISVGGDDDYVMVVSCLLIGMRTERERERQWSRRRREKWEGQMYICFVFLG